MPFYPGVALATNVNSTPPPYCLSPGDSFYLLGTPTNTRRSIGPDNVTGETPIAGQASDRVAIAHLHPSIVPNVGVELIFSANPGAFNLQLQEADSDADGLFITPSPAAFTITSATLVGALYVARVDVGTFGSRFIRMLCSLNPNAVAIIARITLQ